MIYTDKKKYSEILGNSLAYLKRIGFENIQADAAGYETPKSYQKRGSDIELTPNIVAEKEGRKHYFELSLKSDETRLLQSKWLFLKTLSTMTSSQFKIITTRGHYKFTNEMLEAINLSDKKLIKI
ncbi:MAG: hypothetical protein WA749_00060 [Gelidibacter sp.]